ncbi:Dps family protein [Luteipulveratus flavus]|uniref:DNA starvation/stationary phase protection protein n=1 Tax=Luteipulveratus flavus TaxID=3031728 RepID=A0ABT6C507_9MICO|nr:DNA starvation/stationary phase protection protein [Luteipulveratus sp. YIM 133296]MDF8263918.1 DNA starvation/stationary phase protection protein [Luteipulveratus sp. YIM 133296]
MAQYTVPGLDDKTAAQVIDVLQHRLAAYNDLHLTLKHVHWNVVGRNFIAVHEMLDPQVELVRGYADAVAERIAAMGGEPRGRVGDIEEVRDWDDYSLLRDTSAAHLAALNKVYDGVITSNRKAIETFESEPVSQDLIIGQTAELEKFQWFVRAHLEDQSGAVAGGDKSTESGAAADAR